MNKPAPAHNPSMSPTDQEVGPMLYAIVALAVLVADQAVKYFTGTYIELNTGQRELIPGFIHMTNVHNTGAAFSFLEGARWLFVILCLAFVAGVIVLMTVGFIRGRAARWMAVLVIAGGLGNCIDRIVCGYVVDMFEFDFTIFGRQFPIFNVADIFITLGILLFCLIVVVDPDVLGFDKEPKEEKAPAPDGRAASPGRGREEASLMAQIRTPSMRQSEAEPRVSPQKAEAEVDPGDPFAAWDRVGSKKASARANSAAKRIEDSIRRQSGEEESTQGRRADIPAPEDSFAEAPERGIVSPSPSYAEESYDLEDILAEFRDL